MKNNILAGQVMYLVQFLGYSVDEIISLSANQANDLIQYNQRNMTRVRIQEGTYIYVKK